MVKLTKETLLANLYLLKIHLLIFKLFIVKGFSFWVMRILH